MITTLMLTFHVASCDPIAPRVEEEVRVTARSSVVQGIDLTRETQVFSRQAAPIAPSAERVILGRPLQPSIFKVSEQSAEKVPTGMAALYLESNRPMLSEGEAKTLDSMLNALRLSVDSKAIEQLSAPSRAFKMTTVNSEVAVNAKDESQQGIVASIESAVLGV